MLFPKSLVSSMEMAYAIERLVEWRDYQSRAVDNSGRRVYDDDMRRIDGSSSESVLPVIISNIDKLNVIDPLPWDKPGQHGSLMVSHGLLLRLKRMVSTSTTKTERYLKLPSSK